MASLFRQQSTTYALMIDGSPTYRDADGKRVTKSTPGAVKIKSTSPVWSGRYRDASGRPRQVTLCANKTISRDMLNELDVTARQAKRGMAACFEQPGKRALSEHLTDWEASLKAEGASEKHVGMTLARTRKVIKGCGFTFIRDISAHRVQTFLAEMQKRGAAIPKLPTGKSKFTYTEMATALAVKKSTVVKIIRRFNLEGTGNGRARRFSRDVAEEVRHRLRKGIGNQTTAYYMRVTKQFTRWMVANRRAPSDPLAYLSAAPAPGELRRDRRSLSQDEILRILAAAKASDRVFRGLNGIDRFMLYTVACSTGFRAEELSQLTPSSFRHDGSTPVACLGASQAKNGKAVQQPIPSAVAEMLEQYLVGKSAYTPVWPGRWFRSAAHMIRGDLETAGIPYAVDGPDGAQYADFHSLRHTFVSMLDRAGVSLKQAMQLARHSDPKLTAKRYGRAQLAELAGAVDKLPPLFDAPQAESNRATGTFGPHAPYTRPTRAVDSSMGGDRGRLRIPQPRGDGSATAMPPHETLPLSTDDDECAQKMTTRQDEPIADPKSLRSRRLQVRPLSGILK